MLLITGEKSEPRQTVSAREVVLWEEVMKKEAEVASEDNVIDLIPGEVMTTAVRGLKCGHEHKLTPRYSGM